MTQKCDQKQQHNWRSWLLALASAVVVFVALSLIKSVTISGALLTAAVLIVVCVILLRIIK